MEHGGKRQRGQRLVGDGRALHWCAQVDGQALDGETFDREAPHGEETGLGPREDIDKRHYSRVDSPQVDCQAVHGGGEAGPQDNAQGRCAEIIRAQASRTEWWWNAGGRGFRRKRLGGAVLELQPRQARVEAATSAERRVRPFLDDPAAVHHDDAVGRANRR